MIRLYLFEFCDQTWIPTGARECLYETMDACNSGVRSFNGRVADRVLKLAQQDGFDKIVELGAGRAPVTSWLAKDERAAGLTLVPCDLVPNEEVYRRLEQQYPGLVEPIFEPVDITQPHAELNSAVLVMSGMMHHVPFELRPAVVRALSMSNSRIAVFEPLKRSPASMFLTLFAFFPAFLLPITFFNRPGRWRRILWCWLLPIVAPMFVWDGLTSCLRQWTAREWREHLDELGELATGTEIEDGFNSVTVTWSGSQRELARMSA